MRASLLRALQEQREAERMSQRPAAVAQADFRAEPASLGWHRGRQYWIQTCYDLVDGRWEGFVSMHPVEAAR